MSREYQPFNQPNDQLAPGAQIPAFSGLNPELFQMGVNVVTNQFIDNQKITEISQTLQDSQAQIPPYFAITRETVLHRLKNMICPWIVKDWSRTVSDGQKCIPLNNPNAAELYTPLVTSFLYFLLIALIKGIQNQFEIGAFYVRILYFALYIISISLLSRFILFSRMSEAIYPFLTLIADYLCLTFYTSIVCLLSFNSIVKLIVAIYCAASVFLFTARTIASEPCMAGRNGNDALVHTYTIFGVALVQAIMLFVFTYI